MGRFGQTKVFGHSELGIYFRVVPVQDTRGPASFPMTSSGKKLREHCMLKNGGRLWVSRSLGKLYV